MTPDERRAYPGAGPIVLARNLLGVALGFFAWRRPSMAMTTLAVLFGILATLDGIVSLVGAMRASKVRERRWPFVVEGIAGMVGGEAALGVAVAVSAGAASLAEPADVAVALGWAIAGRAAALGATQVAATLGREGAARGEWALAGVVSLVFAVLLFLRSREGPQSLVVGVGTYAFVTAAVNLVAAAATLRKRTRGAPA